MSLSYAEETALRVTIAYLFRNLVHKPTVEEALAEITTGLHPRDWGHEKGRQKVQGIVGQLLTGGRDSKEGREHSNRLFGVED